MSELWYYAKHGQQLGPVSTDDLTQYAAAGQLQPGDLVWKEGMANWAPARTVPGLFAAVPAAAPPPRSGGTYGLAAEPEPGPAPLPSSYPEHYDRPDDEYPRRRQRGGNGVLLGVGIGVAVFLVIGLIVVIAIVAQPGNPRSFNIQAGEKKEFHITFQKGVRAEIWITSQRNTDIDIFVYDANGTKVAQDVRFAKDCYVTFPAQGTQTYRVEVVNINLGGQLPVGPNSCTMRWSPP